MFVPVILLGLFIFVVSGIDYDDSWYSWDFGIGIDCNMVDYGITLLLILDRKDEIRMEIPAVFLEVVSV